MPSFLPGAFGWQRDLPDPRDYGTAHPNVLAAFRSLKPVPAPLAKKSDWSEYFPPAEDNDQRELNACSACAVAALAGYFERRSIGGSARGSRLFLYQAALRLSGSAGDCGVGLRATLRALARFGLPPERLWPYDPGRFGEAPDAFLYACSSDQRLLTYFRLDTLGVPGELVLRQVKSHLAAGFPSVFGFPVFDSLLGTADIAFPTRFDAVQGGCAVVAVGYDDARRIRSTKGALRILSPWGPGWGDGGYGWLPYPYVIEGLAVDFWSVLRSDWLASGELLAPVVGATASGPRRPDLDRA